MWRLCWKSADSLCVRIQVARALRVLLYMMAPLKRVLPHAPTTRKYRQKSGETVISSQSKPNSWTYNFVEVSGHNLESSETWSFPLQWMFKLQNSSKPLSLKGGGGGVKSVGSGDSEQQGGKLFRLLSQWRPRIRPLLAPQAGPVFVDVYGHLGIDSKNRFRMKIWFWRGHGTWAPRFQLIS